MDLTDSEYDAWQDRFHDAVCGDCDEECEDCPGEDILGEVEGLVFDELDNLFTFLNQLDGTEPKSFSTMTDEEKMQVIDRFFTQRKMVKDLLTSRSEGDSGDRARDLANHFIQGLDLSEKEDLDTVREEMASIFEGIAEEARESRKED